jgi:flagellar assembly protein FliH
MILRGAVVSEKRFALEPQRLVLSQASTANSLPAAGHSPAPGESTRALPAPPAPLTLDKVVAWLENSDTAARAHLAELLATDIEAQRAAARDAGLLSGHAAGLAQATQQWQASIDALARLVQQAELAFDAEVTALSAQCAEVVCTTLAKIAGPALSTREAALGTVLEVLQRVKEDREVIIRVSAADLPALREAQETIARALGDRKFLLAADPRIGAGGCIVESSLGSLDGRFDVQLRAVSETLRAAKSGAVTRP